MALSATVRLAAIETSSAEMRSGVLTCATAWDLPTDWIVTSPWETIVPEPEIPVSTLVLLYANATFTPIPTRPTDTPPMAGVTIAFASESQSLRIVMLPTWAVPPCATSMIASKLPFANAKPAMTPTLVAATVTLLIDTSASDLPPPSTLTSFAVRSLTKSFALLVESQIAVAALAVTVAMPPPAVNRKTFAILSVKSTASLMDLVLLPVLT